MKSECCGKKLKLGLAQADYGYDYLEVYCGMCLRLVHLDDAIRGRLEEVMLDAGEDWLEYPPPEMLTY